MSFWKGVWAIVRKDMAIELRGKEILTTNFMFALLVVVIFNFAFDLSAVDVKEMAAGVLWVAFLFSGALSMNRSFLYEKEDDCLSALMLTPLDRSSIYFGKTIVNLALTIVVMIFIIPVFTVLYNINVMENFVWQAVTLFLGALGFICVGTLISAMSVNIRAREMMGPLLMFPVVAPVVICAVKATGGLIRGEDFDSVSAWLQILAAFDVIYLTISWLVFERILEE